jgi:hypothetical protein
LKFSSDFILNQNEYIPTRAVGEAEFDIGFAEFAIVYGVPRSNERLNLNRAWDYFINDPRVEFTGNDEFLDDQKVYVPFLNGRKPLIVCSHTLVLCLREWMNVSPSVGQV